MTSRARIFSKPGCVSVMMTSSSVPSQPHQNASDADHILITTVVLMAAHSPFK